MLAFTVTRGAIHYIQTTDGCSSYVILTATATFFVGFWHGVRTTSARKPAGITYPTAVRIFSVNAKLEFRN